jgi:hypothetical protein
MQEEIATIVVCEKDEPTLDLLCEHLVADRFEVLPAPSAADALRLCRYNHPDLLLLDLAGVSQRQILHKGVRDPTGPEDPPSHLAVVHAVSFRRSQLLPNLVVIRHILEPVKANPG